MSTPSEAMPTFKLLGLAKPLLSSLEEVGYEIPTPIQAQTIPLLLSGNDVLGQAQTGTGKTAAFALPLLSRIKVNQQKPQVLVLTPTRELAIQVAEAFQKYASHLEDVHVLPIYGGQSYETQLRQLKRGVHIIVGTPGRVMDHMRRGALQLEHLQTLVLDEADEMLRMGFLEDVEWVLEQIPVKHQIALFSATMPNEIRHIATRFMHEPEQITIQLKTAAASTIRQRMWKVSGMHKLDALTRILEAETFDAMIIFVRTKTATMELDEKLRARGYASAALNGDIAQNLRETIVNKLKNAELDILVATDVVARGLDVERISHVINYDIPYDTEAYIHRIGRTGRAGRKGEAILFVSPREMRMLKNIEKATRQSIETLRLPSARDLSNLRIHRFKDRITSTLAVAEDMPKYREIIEQYQQEHDIPAIEIAAALAKMSQDNHPLFIADDKPARVVKESSKSRSGQKDRRGANTASRRSSKQAGEFQPQALESGMERFRLEVGHKHQVKPKNIVGAIANEADLDSKHIGRIEIYDDYSTIDLPEGMPKEIFQHLKKTWVSGRQLRITKLATGNKKRRKI